MKLVHGSSDNSYGQIKIQVIVQPSEGSCQVTYTCQLRRFKLLPIPQNVTNMDIMVANKGLHWRPSSWPAQWLVIHQQTSNAATTSDQTRLLSWLNRVSST